MQRILRAAGAVLIAGTATAAMAEVPTDRFWGQAGGFFTTSNSSIRIDSTKNGTIGTTVDFESDLGLPKHDTQVFGLVGARIGRKFRIEGEYFDLGRVGHQTLSQSITVGDTTYAANANVAGLLDSTSYRLAIGYSPLLTDKAELGAAIGFHITDFKVQFLGAGSVTSGGEGVSGAIVTEQRGQLAPLPTISGYGNYAINKTFAVHARADWLSLKISDYSGSLVDVTGNVTARIFRHAGIGAGYRYTNYTFKAHKTDFSGRLQYEFQGPVVFLELAF